MAGQREDCRKHEEPPAAAELNVFWGRGPFMDELLVCRAADGMTFKFLSGLQGLEVYLLPRTARSRPKHSRHLNTNINPNI